MQSSPACPSTGKAHIQGMSETQQLSTCGSLLSFLFLPHVVVVQHSIKHWLGVWEALHGNSTHGYQLVRKPVASAGSCDYAEIVLHTCVCDLHQLRHSYLSHTHVAPAGAAEKRFAWPRDFLEQVGIKTSCPTCAMLLKSGRATMSKKPT